MRLAILGALLLRAATLTSFALATLPSSTSAQCLIDSGGPALPGVGADYGSYIASDGDRVVVGQGTWFGRRTATVFERGPLGWSPVATLDGGPVTSAGGAPVAISGDTVMIGNLDDSGERGAVHVYQEIGGVFQQVQVLRPPTPMAPQAHFGRRLVLKGDRAVIAAPMEHSGAFRSGAVYVFERSGGTWTQSARLQATTPEPEAFFGLGVDLDDDRIAVGQPGLSSGSSTTVSETHVFAQVAGSWTVEQTFPPGRLGFGYSVAIEGDRLAIGSYGELTPGEARGAVLVHGLEPSGWVLRDTITNATLPEEARAEALGQRVDLEGERLLIGTSSPELLSGGDTALVLEFSRGGPEVVAQVDAPVPGSRFGTAVALAGDDLWVGAPGEGEPTIGWQTVGAHHVYRLDAQLSAFCEPPLANSTGRRGDLKVSGCASLADNDLVLLASSLPAGATTLFALGDGTSVTPGVFGGAGTLCVSGTVGRYAATISDASGQAMLTIDLLQLPSPTGSISAMVGDIGHVQALYRDGSSSNSTNALSFTVR